MVRQTQGCFSGERITSVSVSARIAELLLLVIGKKSALLRGIGASLVSVRNNHDSTAARGPVSDDRLDLLATTTAILGANA